MFKRWLMSITAGPWRSGSWAALLAVLAVIGTAVPIMMVSPLLFVGSGGVVAITALRQELDGLGRALLLGSLVLLVAGVLVGLGPALLAVVFILFWAPLVLAAQGVRRWGLTGGIQVIVVLTIVVLLVGHQSNFQSEQFIGAYAELFQKQVAAGTDGEVAIARLEQVFGWLQTYFWGWISASFGLLWMVALLLGRYWHSLVDNPGAFAREFEAVRLGFVPVLLALVALMAGASNGNVLAWEVAALIFIGVAWQGLACVQAGFSRRNAGRLVRWVFYSLLVVFAMQMALALALIGVLDNFFNFRRRFGEGDGR